MIPNGPPPVRAPIAGTGLRRFARASRPAAKVAQEHCELCGVRLGSEHRHMVDPQQRSIACACTACALLFTRPGGRYRTVPDRVRHDPAAPLTEAEWAELSIPVAVAFFFVNSALGRVIASYPSPVGVTECELDLGAWSRLAVDHPLLRALEPDVEAILIVGGTPHEAVPPQAVPPQAVPPQAVPPQAVPRETAALDVAPAEPAHVEAFLVPIDACYSLAGALRREWRGFDGGAEVRHIMADLLAGLRRRARPLDPAMTGPAV